MNFLMLLYVPESRSIRFEMKFILVPNVLLNIYQREREDRREDRGERGQNEQETDWEYREKR